MKKKIICLLVMCALIISVNTVAAAATDNGATDDGIETMGMLTLGDQGIRIHAKVADINAYLSAKTDAEKEKVLSAMMNDSDNKVMFEQETYTNAEDFNGPCDYVGLESAEDAKGQTSQQTEQEEWGVLNVVDQNVRVYAKVMDILEYVNAEDDTQKTEVLNRLVSDKRNSVTTVEDDIIGLDRVDDEENCEYVDAVATARKPGKWTIGEYNLAPGKVVSYGPSGRDAFDVAYDEILYLYLEFEGERYAAAECKTSYPSSFLDQGRWYKDMQCWWDLQSSGQYRVYVKNFDVDDMAITGGYIEVYKR